MWSFSLMTSAGEILQEELNSDQIPVWTVAVSEFQADTGIMIFEEIANTISIIRCAIAMIRVKITDFKCRHPFFDQAPDFAKNGVALVKHIVPVIIAAVQS